MILRKLHKLPIVDDKKQGKDRHENKAGNNNPDVLKGTLVKKARELKTECGKNKTPTLENGCDPSLGLWHKTQTQGVKDRTRDDLPYNKGKECYRYKQWIRAIQYGDPSKAHETNDEDLTRNREHFLLVISVYN
jgi:hypothetical protein